MHSELSKEEEPLPEYPARAQSNQQEEVWQHCESPGWGAAFLDLAQKSA